MKKETNHLILSMFGYLRNMKYVEGFKRSISLSESILTSTLSSRTNDPTYLGPKLSYMPMRSLGFETVLKNRYVNHVIFWLTISFFMAYHGSLFGGSLEDNVLYMIMLLPVQMLAGYTLNYIQIPRWLFKGAWVRFLTSLLVVSYSFAVIARLIVIHIAEPFLDINAAIDESIWEILSDPIYLIKVYLVLVYLPAVILFLIKMTKERFSHQQRVAILEKEKRSTELNFLKAQMNPHFLFNTLNNIYSLSIKKSEQTPEMILKLSEILDYTIYECQHDRVTVWQEWTLIENYTDLQALRRTDRLSIVVNNNIDNFDAEIAPLILISLVENAFKYALKSKSDHPMIEIALNVRDDLLAFKVINTTTKDPHVIASHKKGIGVQNVKRQLELQYPSRHTIEIYDMPDNYKVILSIQL